MSVGILIMNCSKKEYVIFNHLPFSTRGEILSSFVATKIITYYFLENMGDDIYLIDDHLDEETWPLKTPYKETFNYEEVTQRVIDAAEANGVLTNRKKFILDEDDKSLFFSDFD